MEEGFSGGYFYLNEWQRLYGMAFLVSRNICLIKGKLLIHRNACFECNQRDPTRFLLAPNKIRDYTNSPTDMFKTDLQHMTPTVCAQWFYIAQSRQTNMRMDVMT